MRLWIIRYAKSSWAQPSQPDFERGLNARGKRDGANMVTWLAQQSHPPTWLWTSDAVRAMATTDYVQQGFGLSDGQVQATHELYHASPEDAADVLQQTDPVHRCVALIAHNPGLTYLVNLLVGRNVTDNLPTFGVAELLLPESVQDGWAGFRVPTPSASARYAELVQLQRPKALR